MRKLYTVLQCVWLHIPQKNGCHAFQRCMRLHMAVYSAVLSTMSRVMTNADSIGNLLKKVSLDNTILRATIDVFFQSGLGSYGIMDRNPISKANDVTFGATASEGMLSDQGKVDVPAAANDSASQGLTSHKDEVCTHEQPAVCACAYIYTSLPETARAAVVVNPRIFELLA